MYCYAGKGGPGAMGILRKHLPRAQGSSAAERWRGCGPSACVESWGSIAVKPKARNSNAVLKYAVA
eukprot:4538674-Pyramimonas_sp.AAC.1